MPDQTLAPHDEQANSENQEVRTLPPLVSGARPLVGHALQFLSDQYRLMERGYREHGEMFRLRLGRRPVIVLLGPELARWAFKETDDSLEIGPAIAFTRPLLGVDFYYLAERSEYLHQREIMLPMFRARTLTSYLAIMERRCAEFIARLGDSGRFDLPEEMNTLVLGVIMESFLGADFVRHMPPTVASDFRDFMRGLDPITPSWVPAPHLVRARRARDRMHSAVGDLIQSRRAQPVDPPDFVQSLMGAHARDGTPVSDRWVAQMALGIAFAGHDSTTGHLSWAVTDLLRHPAELWKILAEQSQVLHGGTPLDLATVHRMTCLNRALHETARMHPVAPVILRRAVRTTGVRGHTIPAGADVFIGPVFSHRLPTLFDDPARYAPDRYLKNPGQVAHLHGFGGGGHRCLGEHFAGLLAHVTVTRLFQHFDLALTSDRPLPVRTPAFKGVRSPCRIEYQRREKTDSGRI